MIFSMELLQRDFQHRSHLLTFYPTVMTWLSLARCQGSTLVDTICDAIWPAVTESESLGFGCWKTLALSLSDICRVRCLVDCIGLMIFLCKSWLEQPVLNLLKWTVREYECQF